MCSSHFDSKWQLHVPEEWRFVDRSINLLAEGLYDPNNYISLWLDAQQLMDPLFKISCQRQGQRAHFNVTKPWLCDTAGGMTWQSEMIWSDMTKHQL